MGHCVVYNQADQSISDLLCVTYAQHGNNDVLTDTHRHTHTQPRQQSVW